MTHAEVILIFIVDAEGKPYGPLRVWNEDRSTLGIAMSRSIGDTEGSGAGIISVPDISERLLKNQDKIIVAASDGIWEVLSNEQVLKIAKEFYERGEAEEAAKELVKVATKEWRKISTRTDDITALVIFLNNS